MSVSSTEMKFEVMNWAMANDAPVTKAAGDQASRRPRRPSTMRAAGTATEGQQRRLATDGRTDVVGQDAGQRGRS